jgi:selenide,water dikinase
MAAAGCVIVGGHSIDSPEPTYGFAVTGLAAPSAVVTNAGARPGDVLVLTKPLGVGIITTGIKRGVADASLAEVAIDVMTTPNAAAAGAMTAVGVNAATDVSGFGLLGHLREMLVAAGVAAHLHLSAVPVIDGAAPLAEQGVLAGGSARNLAEAVKYTDFGPAGESDRRVLADAQTSGGLLISVAPYRSASLLDALHEAGVVSARAIGSIVEGHPSIRVDD